MTISRRNFGKAALALGLATGLAPQSAFAAPKIRLRYGTAFPTDHPGVKRIQEAAEDIRQKSDGNIDVQVYPNSQLGSEADMFSQARSGALDFMSATAALRMTATLASSSDLSRLNNCTNAINTSPMFFCSTNSDVIIISKK